MTITMPMPLRLAKSVAARRFTPQSLGTYLYRCLSDAKQARVCNESKWDEIYELYRADVADNLRSKSRSIETAGNERDWHHRINTGKTFEVVETLTAYFAGATFPSDDWFDVKANEPDLHQQAQLVKALAKMKMEKARVRLRFDELIRHWVMYGICTAKVSWLQETTTKRLREETPDGLLEPKAPVNKRRASLDISVMSPHDVWLDPGASIERGGTFARLRHSKEELKALVEDGYYQMDDILVSNYSNATSGDPQYRKEQGGNSRDMEIIEYYGPSLFEGVEFESLHAVWYGTTLIRLADADCWCGNPYVSSTMLPDRDSIYGLSVLDPNRGALHILNVLTNSRLDNLALAIDGMYEAVEDGILDISQVKSRPGAVWRVASKGNITPLQTNVSGATITYQEGQYQEESINKNTSTGPLIGNGNVRAGERVTATEIASVKDAGGNRLTQVHTRFEEGFTLPFLSLVFSVLQENFVNAEIVKIYNPEMDATAFFRVEGDILQFPYDFTPLGAAYVIEKTRSIDSILQLLDISGRVPEMGQMLDYSQILKDLLRQMRFQNPERYLKQADTGMPPQQLGQEAPPPDLGGPMAETAMNNIIAEDGGRGMVEAMGTSTEGVPTEDIQTALMGAM